MVACREADGLAGPVAVGVDVPIEGLQAPDAHCDAVTHCWASASKQCRTDANMDRVARGVACGGAATAPPLPPPPAAPRAAATANARSTAHARSAADARSTANARSTATARSTANARSTTGARSAGRTRAYRRSPKNLRARPVHQKCRLDRRRSMPAVPPAPPRDVPPMPPRLLPPVPAPPPAAPRLRSLVSAIGNAGAGVP